MWQALFQRFCTFSNMCDAWQWRQVLILMELMTLMGGDVVNKGVSCC